MESQEFVTFCWHAVILLGSVGAVIGVYLTPFLWVVSKIETKIDALDTKLSNKIEAVDTKLSNKIEAVDTKLSKKIDDVDTKLSKKIDDVDTKLSNKIDELRKEVHGNSERIIRLEVEKEVKSQKEN